MNHQTKPQLFAMLEILPILSAITFQLNGVNIRTFSEIIKSVYSICSGGVTMLNISRWSSEKGGSYSSIRRFYETPLCWMHLNLNLFWRYYHNSSHTYLLSADETVEDKAGKKTPGIGYFFSSIFGVPISGICLLGLSIVDVERGKSWMLGHALLEKDPKKGKKKYKSKVKTETKEVAKRKKKPGRKKGSKNKPYEVGYLFKILGALLDKFKASLGELGYDLPVCYLVGDGHYGNRSGCLVCLQRKLHLISTLRFNADLYYNYEGIQNKVGRKRKYGKKVDYTTLRSADLVQEKQTPDFHTRIYQIKAWHKRIPYCLLNVVILEVQDKEKDKWSRQLYFSTGLDLTYDKLMEYYHLRAQIELNFRDAKQYFGLSDFKNVKPQGMHNAVGLSFFMTNLSKVLVGQYEQLVGQEGLSIRDLKAYFTGIRYVDEIIKNLQNGEELIYNEADYLEIAKIGAVNW